MSKQMSLTISMVILLVAVCRMHAAPPAGAEKATTQPPVTSLKQSTVKRTFLPGGICHDPHKELKGNILEFYFENGEEAPDFALPRLEILEEAIQGKKLMTTKEYVEKFGRKATYKEALYKHAALPVTHPDRQIQCEKIKLSSFEGKKPVVLLFSSFT